MISISAEEFDRAVERALATVPGEFRPYLENVIVEVQDRPSPQLQADEEVPDDLLGLYIGVPLEEQASAAGALPDRILIFRENLQAMCDSVDELVEEIRVTVLHEIGHHFGLDEEQLSELGFD